MRRPSDIAREDGGTASMEMLLTLPFIFILLVLVVDMGYGWIYKMKTNTAARFAGTTFIRTEPGGNGRRAAELALGEHYSALEIQRLLIDNRRRPEALDNGNGQSSGWNRFAQTLFGWLAGLSSRQSVELTVLRQPPVGTLLGDLPIVTFFAIDGNTWTYDEVPLSLTAMVDRMTDLSSWESQGSGWLGAVVRAVSFFFGFVARGLFWMLGMIP